MRSRCEFSSSRCSRRDSSWVLRREESSGSYVEGLRGEGLSDSAPWVVGRSIEGHDRDESRDMRGEGVGGT